MPDKDKKMKKLDWLVSKFDRVNDFQGILAGCIVLFIIGVMFYEVVMRYIFNAPTKFALEISLMSQQVFVGVAAAYVLKIDGHVSLEIVTERLPGRARNCLTCITSLISSAVCGFMTYQMAKVTAWSMKIDEVTSILDYPVYPFKLILTVGLALFALGFLVRGYKYLGKVKQ